MAIAVDLDGTLAKYSTFKNKIGDPIPKMINRVFDWLDKGKEVVIFSARAKTPAERKKIKLWLLKQGLPALEVTNVKSPDFEVMYDDRVRKVEKNTGEVKF